MNERLLRFRGLVGEALEKIGLKEPVQYILEGVPELVGYPSIVQPDLLRFWTRLRRRSRKLLQSLPPSHGPRIILLSTLARKMSWPAPAVILAYALRLRGAQPIFVACDQWLQACEAAFPHEFPDLNEYIQNGPRRICAACYRKSSELYSILDFPFYRLSQFDTPEALKGIEKFLNQLNLDQISNLEYHGVSLKGAIESTILRLTWMNTCPLTPEYLPLWKRHVKSALLYIEALKKMFKYLMPEAMVLDYGGYLARGIPPLIAKRLGVRTLVFSRGYRPWTFKVGCGENIFTDLAAREEGLWNDFEFTSERKEKVLNWLEKRATGSAERVPLKYPLSDRTSIIAEIGLNLEKPLFTLYSNLGWDSKSFYDTPLYPDVADWIFDTIEIFSKRPDFQLVIRIHPIELVETPKLPMAQAIRTRFPFLPSNIHIVGPESKISSYVLGKMSQAVITYGSTIGLEMAALGKPVIVTGNAVYWRKGFTFDVHTREDYCRYIDQLAQGLPPDPIRQEKAQRFTYYFFFAREVPFIYWPVGGKPTPKPWWKVLRSLDQLMPGYDSNLDALCDHILTGRESVAAGSI